MAKAGQLRITLPIACEQIFQTCAIGELRIVLAAAYDFFKLSEKKHSHAHVCILSVSIGLADLLLRTRPLPARSLFVPYKKVIT